MSTKGAAMSPPTPVVKTVHCTGRPWRMVRRNRVNRAGEPLYDIMSGGINPENWEMICDKATEANARLIAQAPALLALLRALTDVMPEAVKLVNGQAAAFPASVALIGERARALLADIEKGD